MRIPLFKPAIRQFTKKDIEKLLPHRGISLVLDSATYDPSRPHELIAKFELSTWWKKFLYFRGHYPENPMFPGHWQIECMCLAGALLCRILFPSSAGFPTLAGMNGVDFKRPIKPGSNIIIRVKFSKKELVHGKIQFFISGESFREGKLASSVEEIRGVLT